MEGKIQRLVFCVAALLCALTASAQQSSEQKDSLIRLVRASSLQLITKDSGEAFRKTVDATFLHNNTYFSCDTAYWNVDKNVVNAIGHVRLTQNGTVLSSQLMDYTVDDNLAQFYGGVVQLSDKDNNTLRTRELDYNTADSVGYFRNGGSFKDKDGQIIEGLDGTYDSKASLFTFDRDVNMFTDSIFIKTSRLRYHTDSEEAVFPAYIDFWKDDNMLSAAAGWYAHKIEKFFFTGKVHAQTKHQEAWADTLLYYRSDAVVEMMGNGQIQDTTRNSSAVADYIHFSQDESKVTLRKRAAVAIETSSEQKDTLYFGADTLIYYTLKRSEVPQNEVKEAKERLSDIMTDPVGEYRKKAAAEAAAAAAEAAKNDPNQIGKAKRGGKNASAAGAKPSSEEKPADEPKQEAPPADTLSTPSEPDTSKVGFAIGIGNVKVFRKDIQMLADSLRYCDLDSIVRFYKDPLVWNDGRRQYSADSIEALIQNQRVTRASLLSNALVVTQENDICFDQIKGAEILAYFDKDAALKRFDALGGALAIFYLQENDEFSTANKVECRMVSGSFNNGQMERVHYFEKPKNNAYPLAQLSKEDRYLKGFKWAPELRPSSPQSITTLRFRAPERESYDAHPRASFPYTDKYFPGYMKSVYAEIEYNKTHPKQSHKAHDDHARQAGSVDLKSPSEMLQPQDSLAAPADSSLAPSDSLASPLDSLATLAAADSLALSDSLSHHEPTKKELRAKAREERRQERETRRALRIARRDARWAELDKKDALKAEQKRQKELARKREKTRQILINQQKQDMRDAAIRNRYIEKYQKQKAREDGKALR